MFNVMLSHVKVLNHFCFRSFFNIFVVGGGTGTISMFLAEQLRYENGEVVYLDFSKHSMYISKQRAKIRTLKNIIFVSDWIETISRLGIYKIPFIQVSGVLHHLKSSSIRKTSKTSSFINVMQL